MEDSAKAYAKQRWKAANHRKRGRGRGRGRGDTAGRTRPHDGDGDARHPEERPGAYLEEEDDINAVSDGTVLSVSTGADLAELLEDAHLQQVQAQYRHRGFTTLHDDELEASTYHGKDLELDLQQLAACLASVPLHQLLRMEPEVLGIDAPAAPAPTPVPHPHLLPTNPTPHPNTPVTPSPQPKATPSQLAPPHPTPQHKQPPSHTSQPTPIPPATSTSAPASAPTTRPATHPSTHPSTHPAPQPHQQPDEDDDSLEHLLSLTAPQPHSRPQPQSRPQPRTTTHTTSGPTPSTSSRPQHQPTPTGAGMRPAAAPTATTTGSTARTAAKPAGAGAPQKTSVLEDLDDLLAQLPGPGPASQAPGRYATMVASRTNPPLQGSASATSASASAPGSRQQVRPPAATSIPAAMRPIAQGKGGPSAAPQPKKSDAASRSLDDWLDNM